MKKLITAIAAIATSFGLFADGPVAFTNSVPSDIQSKTNNLVVGYDTTGATMLDDTGNVTVNWFADSLKTDFTTKMETYEQPELKVGEDEDGSYQYLAIDTDVKDPVLRTFNKVVEDTGDDNFKYNNIEISDHGVFIDTETTFTLFDTDPEAPGDSKILVWAKETEADDTAEPATPGSTNLMVTCGFVDGFGNVTPTNYVLDISSVLPDGLQPETMYRLTIRADKEKDSDNTEFRVYLNTHQLSTVGGLAIFPSIKAQVQELGSAGFGGTGSLKSVDLLTAADAPDFAADATTVKFTYDDKVSEILVNGNDIRNAATNEVIFTIAKADLTNSFEAVVRYENGYRQKDITFGGSGMVAEKDEENEDKVTFSVVRYAAGTIDIESKLARDEVVLTIDGQVVTSDKLTFASMQEVLAYIVEQGKATSTINIKLKLDETASDFGDFSQLSNVTIDLAGHSLTAQDWDPAWDTFGYGAIFVTSEECQLNIVDTSDNGGGSIIGVIGQTVEDSVLAFYNNGTVTIEAATGTNPISIKGGAYNTIEDDAGESVMAIKGGRFNPIITLVDEYVTLPEGKEWSENTDEDGYYYLTEPGAFTLSLTAGANNSISSSPAAGSIAPSTPVVVTVTPDEGYQFATTPDGWVAGANGTIVSNFTMTASVSITAPGATAIPYALTLTGNDTVTITSDQADNTQIPYDTPVTVTVAPKTDYEFAEAAYVGWEKEGLNLVSNFVMKGETTIVAPMATAIEYTITWTSENVVATNNGAQVESGITLAKDATITFYPTVGSITNIVVDDVAVDPVVSPFPFTVKAQASVLKVLAGVTAAPSPIPPEQGTVEYSGSGESAVAKITPNPNVTEITVNNPPAGFTGKYEIPSTVTKITGVTINQLIIKTDEYDIAPACKLVNGGDIVLDDTKTVSEVPVKPTIGSGVAATAVKPADGAIAVKGIAGLYYALVRGDDPATVGTAGTVKAAAMATVTGDAVSLSDNTAKGTKGFYVIKVSIEEPATP